jgi:hypothetical protein
MSDVVEILLKIKDGIVNHISFLKSIINIKCDVSDLVINTDLSDIKDVYIDFKDDYENIENQIEYLNNKTEQINIKLALLCEHIFTTEEIDIDPDTSTQVCYCIKCEYSPRFY